MQIEFDPACKHVRGCVYIEKRGTGQSKELL